VAVHGKVIKDLFNHTLKVVHAALGQKKMTKHELGV
jgi:hypothetical protein